MDLSAILRRIFNLVFTVPYIISALVINFLQLLLHLFVKPWNKNLYRKLNYYLCYIVYSEITFWVEWYSAADIHLFMDQNDYKNYFGKEHQYIISNHRYEIDWVLNALLAEKMHCLGNIKAFMKKSLQYIPTLGWSLYFGESVFLERSFDKDKVVIEKQIGEIVNYQNPIWLLMYPEGTRYTSAKYEVSIKIANEKGLPILKHHLTPRTKGFIVSLPAMKNKMSAIYDVLIAFKPDDENKPTLSSLMNGKHITPYIYVKRIPFNEVPTDETGATKFLHDLFIRKDKLMDSFLKTGDFFTESGVERVERVKLKPCYWSLINTIFCIIMVMSPLLYYCIHLILTGNFVGIISVLGFSITFLFAFNKLLGYSQTNKGSSYGIKNTKNT